MHIMHTIMHFMQELCKNYARIMQVMQNYAKIMQITQKYAKITQKLRICV